MEKENHTQLDNLGARPSSEPEWPGNWPSSPHTAPLESPVTPALPILDQEPTDNSSIIPLVDRTSTAQPGISTCHTCKWRLPTASMTLLPCEHTLCGVCISRAFDWACVAQEYHPPRCSAPCEAPIPVEAVRHRLTLERVAAYEQALQIYAKAASSANPATLAGSSTSAGPSTSACLPIRIRRSASAGPLTTPGPSRAAGPSVFARPSTSEVIADPTNPAQKYCARPSCRRPFPILPKSLLEEEHMDIHFPCPDCGSKTCLICGNYRHEGKCPKCNHCGKFHHKEMCRLCDNCGELEHEGQCVYDEDKYPADPPAVEDKTERRRSWHKCPQCLAIVERKNGGQFGSCLCGHVFCCFCGAGAKYCRCHIPGERIEDELYWLLGHRDYNALRKAYRDAGKDYKSLLVQHKSLLKKRQQILANWDRIVAHKMKELKHGVIGKDSAFDLRGKEAVDEDESKPEDVLKEGWIGRKVEELLKKLSS